MWLPHSLYETLPLLYAASAAACLLTLGLSFGTALSTTALFAAAVTTWNMRRKARSVVLRRTPHRAQRKSAR